MKLSDLHKGDKALIVSIGTDEVLKSRLFSFGITRGTEISIEACSLGKQTVEIMAEETLIGLRMSEAKNIEVNKLKIEIVQEGKN